MFYMGFKFIYTAFFHFIAIVQIYLLGFDYHAPILKLRYENHDHLLQILLLGALNHTL